jgi:hypothetical protein
MARIPKYIIATLFALLFAQAVFAIRPLDDKVDVCLYDGLTKSWTLSSMSKNDDRLVDMYDSMDCTLDPTFKHGYPCPNPDPSCQYPFLMDD